jgi:hypothetical protein
MLPTAQTPAPNPILMPDQGEAGGLPELDQDDSANCAWSPSESNEASRGDKAIKAAKGTYIAAPTIEEVRSAHTDLQNIWKPRRATGKGFMDPEFDELFKFRLLSMRQFMWTYINPDSGLTGRWVAASLKTANNLEKGPAHAKKVREWTQAFVNDLCKDLCKRREISWLCHCDRHVM